MNTQNSDIFLKYIINDITTNQIFIESFDKQGKFDAIKWIITNNYQDNIIDFVDSFKNYYSSEQQYQLELYLIKYKRFDILLKLYQSGYNNNISKLIDDKKRYINDLHYLYYNALSCKKYKLIKYLMKNNCYPRKIHVFIDEYYISKYIFKYLKNRKLFKRKYLEFVDFDKPKFLELFIKNNYLSGLDNFVRSFCNTIDLVKTCVKNNISNIHYITYIKYAIDYNNKELLSILPLKYYIHLVLYDKLNNIRCKCKYIPTKNDIKILKYLLKKGLKRRNKYYNILLPNTYDKIDKKTKGSLTYEILLEVFKLKNTEIFKLFINNINLIDINLFIEQYYDSKYHSDILYCSELCYSSINNPECIIKLLINLGCKHISLVEKFLRHHIGKPNFNIIEFIDKHQFDGDDILIIIYEHYNKYTYANTIILLFDVGYFNLKVLNFIINESSKDMNNNLYFKLNDNIVLLAMKNNLYTDKIIIYFIEHLDLIQKIIGLNINTDKILLYLINNINDNNIDIIEILMKVGGNKKIIKNKLIYQNLENTKKLLNILDN